MNSTERELLPNKEKMLEKEYHQEKAWARLGRKERGRIVLIYGLPGSGKTRLARELARVLNTMHINADEVRSGLNSDLGFSPEDRVENARRLGSVAALVFNFSPMNTVVVDFVNPTTETHLAFVEAVEKAGIPLTHLFQVQLNTLKPEDSRFEDTAKMFDPYTRLKDQRLRPDLVIREGTNSEERLETVYMGMTASYLD